MVTVELGDSDGKMLYIRAVTTESFLKLGELHYTRKTMPENVKNI